MHTMPQTRQRLRFQLFLFFAYCCCASAACYSQTTIEFGADIGIGKSDNIDRLEENGTDETIIVARLGGDIQAVTDTFETSWRWSAGHIRYVDETFDDEAVGLLRGTALIRLSDRLSWYVEDNLGRQVIDPFEVIDPLNREYVNYFSTGPRFRQQLTDQLGLVVDLTVSDLWYETTNLDNQRMGGRIGLRTPTSGGSVMITAGAERIEFDDPSVHEAYTQQEIAVQYDLTHRRNTFRTIVGWAAVRGFEGDGDGLLAQASWSRRISAFSTLGVELGTRYSDAGEIFRFTQNRDQSLTDTGEAVAVGDPFRSTFGRLNWTSIFRNTTIDFNVLWIREDYENRIGLVRSTPRVQLSLLRHIGRRWRVELFGDHATRDYQDQNRKDTDWTAGTEIRFFFTRRINLALQFARFERSSNSAVSFEESRAFLSIGIGDVLLR